VFSNDFCLDYRSASGMFLSPEFDGSGLDLLDRRGEPVPASRVVLDPGRGVSERLPQQRNVLREGALFDKSIRPKLLHHFVLFQDLTAISHKKKQRVESLRREGDKFTFAVEEPVGSVQAKSPELVTVLGPCRHGTCWTNVTASAQSMAAPKRLSKTLETALQRFFQTSSMVLKDLPAQRALS
jgi:hypothetical protein